MAEHGTLLPTDVFPADPAGRGNHTIEGFVAAADEAARLAIAQTSADRGRVIRQLDTGLWYLAQGVTGQWQQIGSGAPATPPDLYLGWRGDQGKTVGGGEVTAWTSGSGSAATPLVLGNPSTVPILDGPGYLEAVYDGEADGAWLYAEDVADAFGSVDADNYIAICMSVPSSDEDDCDAGFSLFGNAYASMIGVGYLNGSAYAIYLPDFTADPFDLSNPGVVVQQPMALGERFTVEMWSDDTNINARINGGPIGTLAWSGNRWPSVMTTQTIAAGNELNGSITARFYEHMIVRDAYIGDAAAMAWRDAALTNSAAADHAGDLENPHETTAAQVGADPAGSAAAAQAAAIAASVPLSRSGFSVVGKATTGAGSAADITVAQDRLVGRDGSGDVDDIQVKTAHIADAQVTLAKLVNASAQYKMLARTSSGAGVWEEFGATAAGLAILDDATAADQRTTLGAPAIAHEATHTAGGTAPIDGHQTAIQTPGFAAGALTIDASKSMHKLTLSANVTSCTISNPPSSSNGTTILIVLIQATGPYTVTLGSAVTWVDGVAPTMPTTSGKRLIISATWDGTAWLAFWKVQS